MVNMPWTSDLQNLPFAATPGLEDPNLALQGYVDPQGVNRNSPVQRTAAQATLDETQGRGAIGLPTFLANAAEAGSVSVLAAFLAVQHDAEALSPGTIASGKRVTKETPQSADVAPKAEPFGPAWNSQTHR
jgi:hypothetical protein